jgi:hypothetical protein
VVDGLATRVQRPRSWANQKVLYDAKRHTHTEQSIGHLATAWSLRRWRGLLYQARYVFRAAAPINLGRWLHRLPA